MQQSSMKELKKMFASEHVRVLGSLFGTEYYDRHTGEKMSKRKAMKILAGNY